MKKAELQEIVPELLKFFNDYIYHQFEISADGIPANADEYRITPEHIRLLADFGEKRTACFAELGLEPFEHTRTTRGETISSSDKTNFLILMFYRKIKDENEFARVLFHEAGHAISAISSPDYARVSDAIKIDSEEIKTVKLGAMIWSECIAETIANRAYEEYGQPTEELYEALKAEKPDVILCPGDLATVGEYNDRLIDPDRREKRLKTQEGALSFLQAAMKIAPVFYSRGNHEWGILSLDFSQIELRVGAFYCRDEVMMDTYRNGGDIHAATTSVIFGWTD